MYRGTTPTLKFRVKFDISKIDVLWMTFKQGKTIVFEKQLPDCQLSYEKNQIIVNLTQEETLSLTANKDLLIQLRVGFVNSKRGVSKLITTYVDDILHDGEI
jgi:hypothetical protein